MKKSLSILITATQIGRNIQLTAIDAETNRPVGPSEIVSRANLLKRRERLGEQYFNRPDVKTVSSPDISGLLQIKTKRQRKVTALDVYREGFQTGFDIAEGFMRGTLNARQRETMSRNPYCSVGEKAEHMAWRSGKNDGYESYYNGKESIEGDDIGLTI